MTAAARVMKARKASLCSYCGGPVFVGNRIALVDDRWWCHLRCAIKTATLLWSSLPPTGTG